MAVRLAIAGPLIIIVLVLGVTLERGDKIAHDANPIAGLAQQVLTLWTILLFPFLGALVPALLGFLEYQGENWKQVLCWPVPRLAIYGAKWLVAYSLLCFSTVVLWLGTAAMDEILRWLRPTWRPFEVPWVLLTRGVCLSFLASTLLISIQMWISCRWRNFIFGVGVGIVALVINIIVLPGGMLAAAIFPWSLPALAMAPVSPHRWLVVIWGLAGGAAMGALACWRLSRRECP